MSRYEQKSHTGVADELLHTDFVIFQPQVDCIPGIADLHWVCVLDIVELACICPVVQLALCQFAHGAIFTQLDSSAVQHQLRADRCEFIRAGSWLLARIKCIQGGRTS